MKRLIPILLVFLALGAPVASAQEASGTRLTLDPPTRTSKPGQLVLSATLFGPSGKLVSDHQVQFYQRVDLFGPREALLGTSTTDSSGVAVLVYEPVERGRLSLLARYAGDDSLPRAESTASVDVSDTNAPLPSEPLPFAALRPWLPLGIGGAVASVWLVLLSVFAVAVIKINAAGAAQKERQAEAGTTAGSAASGLITLS
jgi:hemin uptake protein HemP